MYLNEIYNNLIHDFETKLNNNNLLREDLENIFNFILNNNKILNYFSNEKLDYLKENKLNFYLFFVAFIKNYISDINKYIGSLDIVNEFTDDIANEIYSENQSLELKLFNKKTNEKKLNYLSDKINKNDNKQMLEKIEELIKAVEINQNKDYENILVKYKDTFDKLSSKENEIKNIISETIKKRNKYLKYKSILDSRFNQDITLFESIKSKEDSIDKDVKKVESLLNDIENKISNIIDNNQLEYEVFINDRYPKF